MTTRTKPIAIFLVLLAVAAVPMAVAQQAPTDADPNSTALETDDSDDEAEYSRLSVGVDDGYPDLKPGESDAVTVTVHNLGDEAVTLEPSLEYPIHGSDPLPEDWLEYDNDQVTVEPDGEVEFEVSISVPEDADLARYYGMIAVTDERVEQPGQPAQPLHAARLGVNVYEDPTVHVVSQRYLRGQIEAGDTVTAEIVVENDGDEAVPMNPEIGTDRAVVASPAGDGELDPAWVSIDAAAEIAPGERETVEVTVSPPADAELGNYRTELDLGVRDPARAEGDDYWQRINLDVNVWSQPEEPYVRDFDVSEGTESVELRLTQRSGYGSTAFDGELEPGTFDVTFVSPDGDRISAEREQLSDRGTVDLTGLDRPDTADDEYADGYAVREHVYRVDDPTAGEWAVEIQPENMIGFEYELIRDESGD